jgi:hypothetical protein
MQGFFLFFDVCSACIFEARAEQQRIKVSTDRLLNPTGPDRILNNLCQCRIFNSCISVQSKPQGLKRNVSLKGRRFEGLVKLLMQLKMMYSTAVVEERR